MDLNSSPAEGSARQAHGEEARGRAARPATRRAATPAGSGPALAGPLSALPARLPARTGRPLYRNLMEVLRQAIVRGHWATGDALPSEGEIGARYGVSRITVRHALQLLQFEGYVRTQRARPAVVTAREPAPSGDTRVDYLSELIQGSVDAQIQTYSWRPMPSTSCPRSASACAWRISTTRSSSASCSRGWAFASPMSA
jgi:DNA-binding transcriptional regulator YhcF (GntR family)